VSYATEPLESTALTGGRPLRILRVMPMLGSGGTEVQCVEVLRELTRDSAGYGVQAELATIYRAVVKAPRMPHGVPWHGLDQSRVAQSGMPGAIRLLSKLIPQYDLVHAMLWPAIWATALARRGQAAFIASIHGSHERPGPLGLKRAVDRALTGRADLLVFNSLAGRDRLAPYFGIEAARAEVVPNGKTLDNGLHPGHSSSQLGHSWQQPGRSGLICMARFWPPKRHDLLLEALKAAAGD
jgi:glycosyltransferase involved in cell wall biosynthesis